MANEVGEMVNFELLDVIPVTVSVLLPEFPIVIVWLELVPANDGKVTEDRLMFFVMALTPTTSLPPFLSDVTLKFTLPGLAPGNRVIVSGVFWPGARLALVIEADQ